MDVKGEEPCKHVLKPFISADHQVEGYVVGTRPGSCQVVISQCRAKTANGRVKTAWPRFASMSGLALDWSSGAVRRQIFARACMAHHEKILVEVVMTGADIKNNQAMS